MSVLIGPAPLIRECVPCSRRFQLIKVLHLPFTFPPLRPRVVLQVLHQETTTVTTATAKLDPLVSKPVLLSRFLTGANTSVSFLLALATLGISSVMLLMAVGFLFGPLF